MTLAGTHRSWGVLQNAIELRAILGERATPLLFEDALEHLARGLAFADRGDERFEHLLANRRNQVVGAPKELLWHGDAALACLPCAAEEGDERSGRLQRGGSGPLSEGGRGSTPARGRSGTGCSCFLHEVWESCLGLVEEALKTINCFGFGRQAPRCSHDEGCSGWMIGEVQLAKRLHRRCAHVVTGVLELGDDGSRVLREGRRVHLAQSRQRLKAHL